jgi:uncharacterized protein
LRTDPDLITAYGPAIDDEDEENGVRDGYPEGVPCWIDSGREDAAPMLAFYGELFGWRFEPRGPGYHVATLDGLDVAAIGSQDTGTADPPVWNTYVSVSSAEAISERVQGAGGEVVAAPFAIGEAGTMAVFADPTGAHICVWEAGSHRGAQLVNAAGSWNWSSLATTDLDAASAFYAIVFGWEATTMDFGGVTSVMWRRPGYGDELERLDPGIRQRHADAGAPEGFTDAVAWAMRSSDDRSSWGVTFAVDDADATAARAAELGGAVVVPPYDAGPVREAVLSDPDGAVFSVSRYEPAG